MFKAFYADGAAVCADFESSKDRLQDIKELGPKLGTILNSRQVDRLSMKRTSRKLKVLSKNKELRSFQEIAS